VSISLDTKCGSMPPHTVRQSIESSRSAFMRVQPELGPPQQALVRAFEIAPAYHSIHARKCLIRDHHFAYYGCLQGSLKLHHGQIY
jgi:hypothetical protein